jgi:hypothetical protein
MDTPTLVLLGVITVASLAQAGSLVAVWLVGRRVARGVGGLERSLERELQPTIQQAARLSRDLADISEMTASQARRVSDVLDTAAARVARTGTALSEAMLPSAVRAATLFSVSRSAMAILNAVRRGRSW